MTAEIHEPARIRPSVVTTGPANFEQVVLPHLHAAYSLARWLVRDVTLAEDVVQEAALRALKYFSSFHGGNGRAWLLQIVRNTAYVHLDQRLAATEVALGNGRDAAGIEGIGIDVADPAPDPEASPAHLEEMAQLRAALATLPIEQRECLVLRELEQLSYKEIARIVEVPVGTVMSRLWRARQALISRAPAMGFRCARTAPPSQ